MSASADHVHFFVGGMDSGFHGKFQSNITRKPRRDGSQDGVLV
jgi:hypothetical protein